MSKDLLLRILNVVIILSLFILGFSFLLFKNPKPVILGYVFGVSINILSFLLINDSALKLVSMNPRRARIHAILNYIFRFFIYFIVLFISVKADYLNLIATFLGLTMVKNAIYVLCFIDKDFINSKKSLF